MANQYDGRNTNSSPIMFAKMPTADDWTSLRPFVTDLYQKRQFTARMVLGQLRSHGFIVTLVDEVVSSFMANRVQREDATRSIPDMGSDEEQAQSETFVRWRIFVSVKAQRGQVENAKF